MQCYSCTYASGEDRALRIGSESLRGWYPAVFSIASFQRARCPFEHSCSLALLKILWCDLWPLSILYYSPFLSDCWSICNAFTFESIKPLKAQLHSWYGFVVLVATHTRTVCCIGSAVGWGQRSVHAIVSRPPGVPFGVKVLVRTLVPSTAFVAALVEGRARSSRVPCVDSIALLLRQSPLWNFLKLQLLL